MVMNSSCVSFVLSLFYKLERRQGIFRIEYNFINWTYIYSMSCPLCIELYQWNLPMNLNEFDSWIFVAIR